MEYKESKNIDAVCNIVVLHGFGANSQDLVFLKDCLKINANYYFLQASYKIENDCYCWFPRDENLILQAFSGLYFSNIETIKDEDLFTSVFELDTFIKEKLDEKPLILIGFSQGSMVSWAYSFLIKNNLLKGLVLYSSCLVDKDTFLGLSPENNVKILQTHGTYDEILKFNLGENLYEFLVQKGFDIDFFSFANAHTIDLECIEQTNLFLSKLEL